MTTPHNMRRKKVMIAVVLLLLPLVILQSINNISKVMEHNENKIIKDTDSVITLSKPKGIGAVVNSDIGLTVVCINSPPVIANDCNFSSGTIKANNSFNCTFYATDPNNNAVTYITVWNSTPPFFNMSSNGSMVFNFTSEHALQTNAFSVYAYDNSTCANNYTVRQYYVNVSANNSAPYLAQEIPDQEVTKTYYIVLNLDDYFDDPDGDELSYFPITTSGNAVAITFTDSTAYIRGANCGNSTVYFVATDPFGLTNVSNTVTFNVDCSASDANIQGSNEGDDEGTSSGRSQTTRICDPDWRCTQWSPCRPENLTYRACVDYNGCDPNNFRVFFQENCTYTPNVFCTETWQCSDWGTCQNGTHTRTCLDQKMCGTFSAKPFESESCSVIPECFNGVLDPGETGIDCGGQCGICRNVETPGQIDKFNTRTLIIALLALATVSSLGIYYRRKIAAMYAKLFGQKQKPKRKIFISNAQKDKLVQLLNIIQARLDEDRISHAITELSVFIKEYFKQLLAIEQLTKQELVSNIIKLKDKELEKLLVLFYAKTINVIHSHNKGVEITKEELQQLIDEISHNIYVIGEFTDTEAESAVKDRPLPPKSKSDPTYAATHRLAIIYNELSNLYIALKFGEILVAKEYYKDLMNKYNELTTKEKYIAYADIIRSFHAIEYLEILYKR
ncbi:MAG TPA: hypothetical protein VEC16_02685 [Alphaproteobacteria bacterium]|nr:hypothetical protein [Alphaproteobacteria bacterium]